ncbi:MAG: hypothetical protein C4324_11730, partial [Blastocatellia bacterium]
VGFEVVNKQFISNFLDDESTTTRDGKGRVAPIVAHIKVRRKKNDLKNKDPKLLDKQDVNRFLPIAVRLFSILMKRKPPAGHLHAVLKNEP